MSDGSMTPAELASFLGVHPVTVTRWIRDKRVPVPAEGDRFSKEQVSEILKERTRG